MNGNSSLTRGVDKTVKLVSDAIRYKISNMTILLQNYFFPYRYIYQERIDYNSY